MNANKIIDYILIEGAENIKNHLLGGLQPFGSPMLKAGGYAGSVILQVMVRYEEPKEVIKEVKKNEKAI